MWMCVRPGTPRFTCQAPDGLAYGDLILQLHALADAHPILRTCWSQQAELRRANLSSTIRRVAGGERHEKQENGDACGGPEAASTANHSTPQNISQANICRWKRLLRLVGDLHATFDPSPNERQGS